ncbi:hypothetical protein ACFY5J_20985 [Peribacillus butanolivorans]
MKIHKKVNKRLDKSFRSLNLVHIGANSQSIDFYRLQRKRRGELEHMKLL